MATRVGYLRPISDKSVGHTCSSGSTAYNLLNEETADDDSTYVYQSVSSTSSSSKTTVVNISGIIPKVSDNDTIESVKIYARIKRTSSSYVSTSCTISGVLNSQSYTGSASFSGTSYVKRSVSVPTVTAFSTGSTIQGTISIKTTGNRTQSSKGSNFEMRVTQVYVEVTYTPHFQVDCVTAGSGTLGDSGLVEIDESKTLTITPDTTIGDTYKYVYDNDVDVTSQVTENGTTDPDTGVFTPDGTYSYVISNMQADHTVKVIFTDYVEIYTKIGGTWVKTQKLYVKANGTWAEQTPQIASVWGTTFDTDLKYENKNV